MEYEGRSTIVAEKLEERDIDEILEKRGPFSFYQIMVQVTIISLVLLISYNNVLSYFTGDSPSWQCTEQRKGNFCRSISNESVITGEMIAYNQRCHMDRGDWQYTTARTYSFVTEFDLVCNKTNLAALISSSYYIGGVLGCMVSGVSADTFGRKPILLIASMITTASSIGCSFIRRVWQLVMLNVNRGASTYPTFMCCMLYQSEFVPPTYRPMYLNILLCAFSCSFLLMDLLAYYFKSWRFLSLYVALPCVPIIALLYFLPESPRWLLTHGKKKDAEKLMNRINADSMVVITLKTIEQSNEKKCTILDLFRHTKVVRLASLIAFLWFTIPIVFYSVALESSNLGGDLYEAFALSTVADIISYAPCAYLLNRTGRKKCILSSLFISGILLGVLLVIPKTLSFRYTLNISIVMVAKLGCNTAASGLFTWTTELFPTVLRSSGLFIGAFCDRLGLIIVPFITRSLKDINTSLPFIVIAVTAIVGSIVGLPLPETNNKATRELFEDFFDKSTTPAHQVCGIDNLPNDMITDEEV